MGTEAQKSHLTCPGLANAQALAPQPLRPSLQDRNATEMGTGRVGSHPEVVSDGILSTHRARETHSDTRK